MSYLYLVATPIGNLEDITLRAIRILWEVPVILCEDTRRTGKLLERYREYRGTRKPRFFSYTDYNRDRRIPWVINLLQGGQDVALVSNAGTPLISDPGYKLVKEVIRARETNPEIEISVIPGASAVLTALQLSGFPPDKFFFAGFIPKKALLRQNFFKSLPRTTVVAFESPHRLLKSLVALKEILGDVDIAACRELTKLHENVFRGRVGEAIDYFAGKHVKGEVTLVFCVPRRNDVVEGSIMKSGGYKL